ncbi:MAG: hypothetical protein QNJ88_05170 [Acidimicrobiia bacterium]|nr:hypothetical protein [Acidimicrobiia bacterium]
MSMPVHEMLDALLSQLDADDAAVADHTPGPAPLALIYEGELEADLTEPVIRQIRFDQFVREVVSLGADIAVRMGSAAVEYSVGRDDPAASVDSPDDDDSSTQRSDTEE